jgi:hypothetical protein
MYYLLGGYKPASKYRFYSQISWIIQITKDAALRGKFIMVNIHTIGNLQFLLQKLKEVARKYFFDISC